MKWHHKLLHASQQRLFLQARLLAAGPGSTTAIFADSYANADFGQDGSTRLIDLRDISASHHWCPATRVVCLKYSYWFSARRELVDPISARWDISNVIRRVQGRVSQPAESDAPSPIESWRRTLVLKEAPEQIIFYGNAIGPTS